MWGRRMRGRIVCRFLSRGFRLWSHGRLIGLLLARRTLLLAGTFIALLLAGGTLCATFLAGLCLTLPLHLARRTLLAAFSVATLLPLRTLRLTAFGICALLARRTLLAALFGAALALILLMATGTLLTLAFLGALPVRRDDDLRLHLDDIGAGTVLHGRRKRQRGRRLHQQRKRQYRPGHAGEQLEFLRHDFLFSVSRPSSACPIGLFHGCLFRAGLG
jgi:hypothetical protein